MASKAAEWRTCSYCGETAPPGAACPTCGYEVTVAPDEVVKLPKRKGQRMRFVQALRIVIVVVAVVGLAYALLSTVLAGPPVVADPLTTTGTYSIGAGNYTYLNGNVTGEDYVQGNYTVLVPYGTLVSYAVFNQTEFQTFQSGQPAQPIQNFSALNSGRIVFAAPYTDMYYFVFANPYPVTSGIAIHVYVATTYETNVVMD